MIQRMVSNQKTETCTVYNSHNGLWEESDDNFSVRIGKKINEHLAEKKPKKVMRKTVLEMVKEVLTDAGLMVNESSEYHNMGAIQITHEDIINPAELRSCISHILSTEGFSNYYLKDVYYYTSSKNPHRTDQNGHVELGRPESFQRMTITKVGKKK